MTLLDIGKINDVQGLRLALQHRQPCDDCDGTGFDDFLEIPCEICDGTGTVSLKQCSGCKKWLLSESFYGQTKKQSRCIPCYKVKYFGAYRRLLRVKRQML